MATKATPASNAPAEGPADPYGVTLADRIRFGALALFVVCKVAVISAADLPAVLPDEPGTWAVAGALAGGPEIHMADMPTYPLVPGAALAPLWWLPLDASNRYRLALVLLAVLTVLAAFLVDRGVRTWQRGGPLAPAVGFATVLLFPATVVTGAFTWAETFVVLTWAVLFWGLVTIARAPEGAAARAPLIVTSVAAGLAPSVHARLIAVPLVWLVALVGLAVAERHRARSGESTRFSTVALAVAGAITVVTAVTSRLLASAVVSQLWTEPTSTAPTDALSSLGDGAWWRDMGLEVLGQLWYAVAASAGLALVGGWWLVRRAGRGGADDRWWAGTLAALIATNVAISVLTMGQFVFEVGPGGTDGVSTPRWDHLVYGRYIDGAVLVLTVVGVAVLLERRATTPSGDTAGRAPGELVVAGAFAGLAALVVATGRAGIDLGDTLVLNIAGVAIHAGDGTELTMAPWTLGALAAILVVALAATRPQRTLVLAVVVLLGLGAVVATAEAMRWHRTFGYPALHRGIHAAPPDRSTILVAADAAADPSYRLNAFAQQYALAGEGWDMDFDRRSSDDLAEATSTAGEPQGAGVLVLVEGVEPTGDWIAQDRFGDVVIWRRPYREPG